MSSEKLYDELISKLDELCIAEMEKAFQYFVDGMDSSLKIDDDEVITIDIVGPEKYDSDDIYIKTISLNAMAEDRIKEHDRLDCLYGWPINDIDEVCKAFEKLSAKLRTMVEERKLKGH